MDKHFYLARVESDPSDTASLRALAEFAIIEGEWEEAAKRLKEEANFHHKGPERSSLFYTAALIHFKKLSNPEEALAFATRAIDAYKENISAIHLKRTLLSRLSKWGELVELIQEEANLVTETNPGLAGALHLVRARFLLLKLNNPEASLSAIREAGDSLPALEALEEYYLQNSAWEELVGTLLRLHDGASDPAFKASQSLKAAYYLENMIKDIGRAKSQYNKVLAEIDDCPYQVPADEVAVRASLAEMSIRSDEPGDAASHLARIIELDRAETGGKYQAAIRQRAAKVYRKADSKENAMGQLVEARKIKPEDLRILEDIEELTRGENPTANVENIEYYLKMEKAPARRAALLIQKGRAETYLLNKPEQGVASFLQAKQEVPEDMHILAELAAGYREAGAFEELANILKDLFILADSDKLKAGLATMVSIIKSTRLSDAEQARDALTEALKLPPTSLTGLMMLEDIEGSLKAYDRLAGVLEAQAQMVTDRPYLKHLHLKAAFINWEILDRDDAAFKSLAQVIGIEPESPEAISALKLISAKNGSWSNVESAIKRELEAEQKLDEPKNARILFYMDALARLAVLTHKDPKASESLFNKVLETCGEDVLTRMELASLSYARGDSASYAAHMSGLCGALESTSWNGAYRQSCALSANSNMEGALTALKSILDTEVSSPGALALAMDLDFLAGQWIEAIQHMTKLSELLDDSSRSTMMRRIGRIHLARLEDRKAATQCFGHAVELDGNDVFSMETLRSLHSKEGNSEGEVNALAMLAGLEQSAARKAALKSEISAIRETGNDLQNAAVALEEAVGADPQNVSMLRRLELIFERTGETEKAATILRQEIPLRDDERLKVTLNLKLAQLEEKLGKPGEAAEAYEAALSQEPTIVQALDRLVEIYDQLEKWSELASALKRRADLITDNGVKLQDLMRLAGVREDNLNDDTGALEALREAHGLDPDNLLPVMELERLTEKVERYDELDEILSKQAVLNKEADILLRIYLKQGGVRDKKLERLEPAIESYVKALEKDGKNLEAVTALESLYERTSKNSELIEILELRSTILPEEAASLHIRVANIWEERLGKKEEAATSLYKALEAEATNLTAIDGLIKITGKLERWEDHEKVLATKAAVVPREEAMACHLERASILKDKLGNPAEALVALNAVLQLDSLHLEALQRSAQIAQEVEKWEEAVGFLGRQIDLLQMDERLPVHTRMGQIAEIEITNDARASRHYEDALIINPLYMDALRPLSDIYFKHSRWPKAEPLLKRWTENFTPEESAETKAQVYFKMGRTVAQIGREDEALQWLEKAISEDENQLMAAAEVLQVRLKRGEYEAARNAGNSLLKAAKGQQKPDEIFFALKTLGDIEEKLSNPDEAIKRYLEALEVRPSDIPIMEELVRLYTSSGNFEYSVQILDREIAVQAGTADEATTRYRKGVILNDNLSNPQGALQEFDKALELNPEYLEAQYQKGSAHAGLSQWEDARKTLEDLTNKEKRREELADSLALLGKVIKKGFNDPDKASSCYERALVELPTHVPSVEALGELYEEVGDWPKFAETYQRFIKLIPQEEAAKALPLHMKLGEVYRDKLSLRDKAIIEFQHAVRLDQTHVPAHAELAKLYISERAMYPNAIKSNQMLIRLAPNTHQAYHDMAKIYEETRDHDRALIIYSLLELMGVLDKTESLYYEAYKEKAPLRPGKALDDEAWQRAVLHPLARSPLSDILPSLSSALASVFDAPPRAAEKLPSGHALTRPATEFASWLEVEAYNLFLDNAPDAKVLSFANTDPVSIYFSAKFITPLPPQEQRYIVAKALAMARMGIDAIWNLSPQEAKLRMRVIAKMFNSDVQVPDTPEKDAAALAKKLKKSTARKVRKGVEGIVERYIGQEQSTDFEQWKKGVEFTADRAALVLTGDITHSIKALTKEAAFNKDPETNLIPPPTSLEPPRELISFSVTDPFFVLRKKVGMSIL